MKKRVVGEKSAERYSFAKNMVKAGDKFTIIHDATKKHFGTGIDTSTYAKIRKELRANNAPPEINTEHPFDVEHTEEAVVSWAITNGSPINPHKPHTSTMETMERFLAGGYRVFIHPDNSIEVRR